MLILVSLFSLFCCKKRMVTMSVLNSHCVGFNRYCRLISSHSLISLISTSNRHPYPYHSTAISTTTLCAKSDTDNKRKPISKYRTESSSEYARLKNNKIITGDSSSSSSSGVRLNKCLLGLSRNCRRESNHRWESIHCGRY